MTDEAKVPGGRGGGRGLAGGGRRTEGAPPARQQGTGYDYGEAAEQLGKKLREYRESANLTQQLLADQYGFSTTAVSRYETGQSLPKKGYIDALLHEVDQRLDSPLTAERRKTLYYLLRQALGPKNGKRRLDIELFEAQLARDLNAQERDEARADIADRDARLLLATNPAEREQLRREREELVQREAVLNEQRGRIQHRIDELQQLLSRDQEPGPDQAGPVPVPPPPAFSPQVPGAFPPPGTAPFPEAGAGPFPPLEPGPGAGRPRWTQWTLASALAVALALLAVIALRPQILAASAQSGSTSHPATTPGTAPPTSAPPASAPASAGASPGTASAAPSSSGVDWTAQYRDSGISLPPTDAECGLESMDFDPPHGYEGSGATGRLDDLTAQVNCSMIGTTDHILMFAKAWGTSSAQEPGPGQCWSDANSNGLPQDVALSKITVGSAYCLITGKNEVTPGMWTQGFMLRVRV